MQTYDLQKMQDLLQDFYNLTDIKLCIYDNAENELCFYPEKLSAFCALLRSDKEMDARCKNCDRHAFSVCKKTREQYVYTCHAGLLECVSPILYGERIIGYIVLGQIKTHEQADFSRIEGKLPEALRQQLAERFEMLPAMDLKKINSAMRIVDACTGYEYLKGLVKATENKIDVLLDEYINKRLSEDLSVQILCSAFRLSHNEIYSIFKEYFQATPAEYIKIRRLNHACDLLKETALPVHKIAKQCGIPDYNYFSKIFKRYFGVSPRAYRQRNGNAPLPSETQFPAKF